MAQNNLTPPELMRLMVNVGKAFPISDRLTEKCDGIVFLQRECRWQREAKRIIDQLTTAFPASNCPCNPNSGVAGLTGGFQIDTPSASFVNA